MASLSAIRAALKATIVAGVNTELFCYDTVSDKVNLPAMVIEPGDGNFELANACGMDEWFLHLFVLCSRAAIEAGQNQLDGFVAGSGPDSIRRAVFENPTLSLADDVDATVIAMRGYGGALETARVPHVGAVLVVRVYTDGRRS